MLFRQFVDDDLGCASYLIGDPSKGEAFLVDPAYAIEQYLDAATESSVRIMRVLETHTHADHVSGHGRLALEHGVPVSVHPLAEPEFPFEPLTTARSSRSVPCRYGYSIHPVTGRSTAHSSWTTGSYSRVTPCSSATPRDPTSRSRRAKARKGSFTHCSG